MISYLSICLLGHIAYQSKVLGRRHSSEGSEAVLQCKGHLHRVLDFCALLDFLQAKHTNTSKYKTAYSIYISLRPIQPKVASTTPLSVRQELTDVCSYIRVDANADLGAEAGWAKYIPKDQSEHPRPLTGFRTLLVHARCGEHGLSCDALDRAVTLSTSKTHYMYIWKKVEIRDEC
jgi:hypothetical protein